MNKETINTAVIGVLVTVGLMVFALSVYQPATEPPTSPPTPPPTPVPVSEATSSSAAKPGPAEPAAAQAGQRSAGTPSSEHPGFPLPDLQGRMWGPADYRGKIVLVNFWATWCGPCRQEIPDFIEIYKQYHARGLEVLGVAVDDQGAPVVKPFAENAKINYPVLLGSGQLLLNYGIQGIPTTLVLDRQGKLHTRLVGAQNKAQLETLLKSLL